MLTWAVVIGLVSCLRSWHPLDLAALDYLGSPAAGLMLCLAFAAGSLPLLAPQHEPPKDLRHNRWYIAVMVFATLLQGVFLV